MTADTSAEVAGAEYDQIHSLAGAGMPGGWEADPGTTYSHWAYTDALTMIQETGTVWGGNIPANIPANSSAFDSRIYEREEDFDIRPRPGSADRKVASSTGLNRNPMRWISKMAPMTR